MLGSLNLAAHDKNMYLELTDFVFMVKMYPIHVDEYILQFIKCFPKIIFV